MISIAATSTLRLLVCRIASVAVAEVRPLRHLGQIARAGRHQLVHVQRAAAALLFLQRLLPLLHLPAEDHRLLRAFSVQASTAGALSAAESQIFHCFVRLLRPPILRALLE
jgi:hypothetical protein